MPNLKGNRHVLEARQRISESLRRAWAEGRHKGRQTGRYKHTEATKTKIGIAHQRLMAHDPAYRKMRRANAILATHAARVAFLRNLGVIALANVPMRKADAARLRTFACVLCLTKDRPRELAHIQARSNGGPHHHTWGNAIPLCRSCHDRIDHSGVLVIEGPT